MKHCFPDITSPPLRRRMAQSLNHLRRQWLFLCKNVFNVEPHRRRDILRTAIHEMARLEQALDDEQDAIIHKGLYQSYVQYR